MLKEDKKVLQELIEQYSVREVITDLIPLAMSEADRLSDMKKVNESEEAAEIADILEFLKI